MEDVQNHNIIIATHLGDELIGCFEVLNYERERPVIIIYVEEEEESEVRSDMRTVKKAFPQIKSQVFVKGLPLFFNQTNTIYLPDPIYTSNPFHRYIGMQGEEILRRCKLNNIIFYDADGNAPYKFPCPEPKLKKLYLNECYPSKIDKWNYNPKFYLYSGYNKWIMFGKKEEKKTDEVNKPRIEEKV